MSAESDTVTSIEVGIDRMLKLRVYITDRRIHYLAHSAYVTMQYGMKTYWNKHYNRQAGITNVLALFQGGGDLHLQVAKRRSRGYKVLEPSPNTKDFRSRNGNKRLVSYKFGKPHEDANFQSSNLIITSFPMNWYERDVMMQGWSSVAGKIRKGTHIMRALNPKAQSELDATGAPMLADIERRYKEMENGR